MPKPDSYLAIALSLCLSSCDHSREIAELSLALQSANAKDRKLALEELTVLGTSARSRLGQIIALCDDPDIDVQHAAIKALPAIGGSSPAVIEALLLHLEKPHGGLAASGQLGRIGGPAIPGLCSSLRSPNADARFHAAMALRDTRKEGQSGVGQLVACLSDASEKVRVAASIALSEIGLSDDAVGPVLGILDAPDRGARIPALVALCGYGGKDKLTEVVARICAITSKDAEDVDVRCAAARTLAALEGEEEKRHDCILALLENGAED